MVDSTNFESFVWVSIAGGLFGVVGLTVRAILKSNCKKFSCCFGIISCMRSDTSQPPSLTPLSTGTESNGAFGLNQQELFV